MHMDVDMHCLHILSWIHILGHRVVLITEDYAFRYSKLDTHKPWSRSRCPAMQHPEPAQSVQGRRHSPGIGGLSLGDRAEDENAPMAGESGVYSKHKSEPDKILHNLSWHCPSRLLFFETYSILENAVHTSDWTLIHADINN